MKVHYNERGDINAPPLKPLRGVHFILLKVSLPWMEFHPTSYNTKVSLSSHLLPDNVLPTMEKPPSFVPFSMLSLKFVLQRSFQNVNPLFLSIFIFYLLKNQISDFFHIFYLVMKYLNIFERISSELFCDKNAMCILYNYEKNSFFCMHGKLNLSKFQF